MYGLVSRVLVSRVVEEDATVGCLTCKLHLSAMAGTSTALSWCVT